MALRETPWIDPSAGARAIQQLQEACAGIYRALRGLVIVEPIEITQVSVVAGANDVIHGLGRVPRACVVTSSSAASNVTFSFDRRAASTTTRTMVLNATAPSVVDLLVW